MSQSHKILVASYTNDISTLTFEPETNRLYSSSTLNVGHHPSWIARHPRHSQLMFTVLEGAEGKVAVLEFDLASGKGKVVGRGLTGGEDPCTLVVSEQELLIGNYSSGSLAIYPVKPISPYLATSSPKVLTFNGSGPNADRQTSSHAHHTVLHAGELLVPDLGADKTWRLIQEDGEWKVAGHLEYDAGSGPRHVAVHDGILYTILELTNRLASHRLPALPEEATFTQSLPTMLEPPALPHGMLAAEICIPPPNKTFPIAYIYVSNRNDTRPGGDSIAIFSITPFELVAEVRTGLNHVRGAVFGGPDDRWLSLGGVNGGGVKIFERVDSGKGLEEIAVDASIESPTGFVWL